MYRGQFLLSSGDKWLSHIRYAPATPSFQAESLNCLRDDRRDEVFRDNVDRKRFSEAREAVYPVGKCTLLFEEHPFSLGGGDAAERSRRKDEMAAGTNTLAGNPDEFQQR